MLPVCEHGDPGSLCKDPITDTFGGGLFLGPCNGCGCCSLEAVAGALPPHEKGHLAWTLPVHLDLICAGAQINLSSSMA